MITFNIDSADIPPPKSVFERLKEGELSFQETVKELGAFALLTGSTAKTPHDILCWAEIIIRFAEIDALFKQIQKGPK